MHEGFLDVTDTAGRDFVMRQLTGPIEMLNLLRYRDVADYAAFPNLAPQDPISGRDAYGRYMACTAPVLDRRGGEVLYFGEGGPFLIGPASARWDTVMMVRHASTEAFLAMASDEEYLRGAGHRSAALADSRLLPVQPVRPG